MPITLAVEDVAQTLAASCARAEARVYPFRNWRLERVLPEAVARGLAALPFAAPELGGVSGKRELHNATRRYLAGDLLRIPEARALVEAFQSTQVVLALTLLTGALLVGTYLRVEYALDLDGFWLEPHTDIGAKAFTLFLQLGLRGQDGLGTDLYLGPDLWTERIPFEWNAALAFVPSERSWHGFQRRPIVGVRRSIIVNYVTADWRERGQLAFPDRPVRLVHRRRAPGAGRLGDQLNIISELRTNSI